MNASTTHEAARTRLLALKRELREAEARRKQALTDAKERCRAERVTAREKVRAMRRRGVEELREIVRAELTAAREACSQRQAEARGIEDGVARARAALRAEEDMQRDARRIAREDTKRRRAAEKHVESDDEVRAKLPSDLAALFDRVRTKIKGSARASRTEEFLRYAERHPDEVLAVSGDPADARVRELKDETRRTAEALLRPNAYEAKKAARVERMRERADHLAAEAEGADKAARRIADAIPLGQPVLVGHHSQRRHERDLEKMRRGFGKAVELERKATELRRRADFAEANRAVSSDDPDAVSKLREKLEANEARRARMVAANKAIRSRKPREGLRALGFSERVIDTLMTLDVAGRVGFADYALQNAAQESRRLRQRIAELEARKTKPAPPPVVEPSGVRIEETDNRLRVYFPAKPAADVRARLKSEGFRWAPSEGAWQRFASPAAWLAAKRALRTEKAAPPPAEGAACGCVHLPEDTSP